MQCIILEKQPLFDLMTPECGALWGYVMRLLSVRKMQSNAMVCSLDFGIYFCLFPFICSFYSLLYVERTISCRDAEAVFALSKLAKLHEQLHDNDKAAFYYKKNLDKRDQEQVYTQKKIHAATILAKIEITTKLAVVKLEKRGFG